jgi:hypothetical protein
VNAISVADLLGLGFGFVWPRGRDGALNDPGEIFSPRYLDTFEFEAGELEDRSVMLGHQLLELSRGEADRRLDDAPGAFVDMQLHCQIARAAWEDDHAARTRFLRSWGEIGWSEEVAALLTRCQDATRARPIAAVHVRAGDIVDGDWRQVMHHEKYIPSPFVDLAIDTLLREQNAVLILSDNDDYLNSLLERFPAATTGAQLLPGYEELSEIHRALADIFLLAQCRLIVGPPSSAFSRVPANLGPGRVVRADELATPGEERDVLLAGIAARRPRAETTLQRRLLARDTCWCLDVFGEELALDERLRLARDTVELDDFSGGAARLARLAAVAGDLSAARAAADRALTLAESVERCDDALLEALASDVVVRCFATVRSRPRSVPRWAPPTVNKWRQRQDRRAAEAELGEIEVSFDRSLTLVPYWSAPESVRADLREMIDIVRWCSEQPAEVRRVVAAVLAPCIGPTGPEPGCASSLEDHRHVAMYDPLTRDLDRILSNVKGALGPIMTQRGG